MVRDSCRVLLLVALASDWRETLGTHLDRIRWECLWRRRRRSVNIFSLQGISYVFLHEQTSRRERSVLVLVFQEFFLTFSFQGKRSDPQGILFFVGEVNLFDLNFQTAIDGFQGDCGMELNGFTWFLFDFLALLVLLLVCFLSLLVECGIPSRRMIVQRIIDHIFLLLFW